MGNEETKVITNNQRIAKNTLMLYIRMILIMGVTLYTSRVILDVLGVENYGIFSVVGGIITMFAFINGGMISATQRYITFEIGMGDTTRLKTVFSTSFQIHVIIALLIAILGETAGLWFLHHKLVIPPERMDAALWVYHCSILASVVNVLSIPYNASIIAYEKMSAFAYISVVEVLLKLGILFLLILSPWDRLAVYAVLLLIVQFSVCLVYIRYCHKHFEATHYSHRFDRILLKEMASFAGWSFWGNLAGVLYTQGLNMMLNIFFGPVVNAARGIAVQVQAAVQQFVSNFQMALNPQITKNYAVGNLTDMHNLMCRSARFSFLLLYLLALPIWIETPFILRLWLHQVPEHTVVFTRIMLAISLIYTTASPCVVANQATGKVKVYQAVVGGILLLILPLSYLVLRLGAPAYSVFIVHLGIECMAQFSRMWMLRKLIDFPVYAYFQRIYGPVALVVLVSVVIPVFLHSQFEEGWLRFLIIGVTSLVMVSVCAFFLGLTKGERRFITDKVVYYLSLRK